ncbi:MAG: C25 family cysteine peptidase [Planctomycetota bacterium]
MRRLRRIDTATRGCLLLAVLTLTLVGEEKAPAPPSFLIIAPHEFVASLRAFQQYKNAQMPTELVALESALKTEGVDAPERLKRFLYEAWRARGVRYALLVGDADVLPVRYMVLDRVTAPAFDYAFYPSDLYYADVARADGSFDDWNAERTDFHAGYFGEVRGEKNKSDPINFDAIDYRAEVAVGRWPVATTAEVARVAAKTMTFEKTRAARAAPRRAAFVAVDGWVDMRVQLAGWAKSLEASWSCERRFFARPGETASTAPPTVDEILGLFNNGTELIIHAGHGGDDAWHECLNVSHIPRLTNTAHPAIAISAGCSTARLAALPPYEAYIDVNGVEHKGTNAGEVFTAPPPPPAPVQPTRLNGIGLGRQLLRQSDAGAVAYIGCNTGSQPCGLSLVEGLVRALAVAKPDARLGDLWVAAIRYYYEHERLATIAPTPDWYPASVFFQGMKFMFFGDPTLRVGSQ